MKSFGRVRARGERGAAAVEFALVVPMLLLVIFGSVDFARAIQSDNTLGNAAREGAREGAVNSVAEDIRIRVAGALAVPSSDVGVRSLTAVGAPCTLVSGKAFTVCVTCRTAANVWASCPAPPLAPISDGTIRVQVRHTYGWVTPVGALMKLFGAEIGSGVPLSEVVEMRIE